ncbi:MAG TPA: ABC transporter ATP-binding protein, partial [Candidatus Binataceae bacterium]|nr:ABC transporter ATP-binding protein [Candidatus Binataceae bacterium]
MKPTHDNSLSVSSYTYTRFAAAPETNSSNTASDMAEVADTGHDQQVPAVEMRKVAFTYDGAVAPALRGIDLMLKAGEMVGIMGASGAGKSTLAKCLNRLVPAFERGQFSGVVRIHGRVLDGAQVSEIAPLVGMVFQDFEAQLFSTNVSLEVAFTMQQIGMPRDEIAARIEPALAAVGLSGFTHRDPTSLSGGEKQRLAIAAVLALRPSLIVLDEPTTDLDPEGKAEVFALIRELRAQGLTLIVIEHEADELRGCDRLLLLENGELVAEGSPALLMPRVELLENCGVHPPDLNRVLTILGIRAHAGNIDEAEALIRQTFPKIRQFTGKTETMMGVVRTPEVDGFVTPDSSERRIQRSDPATPEEDSVEKKRIESRDSGFARYLRITGSKSEMSRRGPPSREVTSLPEVKSSGTPIAEAEQLCYSYALGPRVLDAIDFRILPGEFVAIVGQNGSGKTTLAKHLVGLLTPTQGRVLLEGRDRKLLKAAETTRIAGYVFQNPDNQIFAATVEEEIAFGLRNFGLSADDVERRVAEVLQAVNLENFRQRDPFLLSKGERQRLAVASVLALRPQLLILDEPTTGLDYR